ncbi:HepT-like ribonuclease domain-containing protein [Candidatus Thiosymbion oneisti]|nr:HepT-like ribonuclease domain-containing protein [Candidatus Thiosymbion oneisti]
MRNALAHGYFKVDLGIAWDTIETDLPGFAKQVRELRDGLS